MATKERALERNKNFFLAAATHELRTPMTCILGFAELLEKRDYDSAQVRSLSTTIRAKAQEMNRLLDDLLDVSALDESSSMAVRLKPSDISQAVETAVHRMERPSINHRIALRVEPALPAVMLDSDRFVQAIVNVLSNACKYSPDGSEVRVDVFRASRGGAHRVGVRIADCGVGMTPVEVKNMFSRFWRSERAAGIKGTGLGMVITKLILDRHGATIEVDSRPGEGTIVTVWLKETR